MNILCYAPPRRVFLIVVFAQRAAFSGIAVLTGNIPIVILVGMNHHRDAQGAAGGAEAFCTSLRFAELIATVNLHDRRLGESGEHCLRDAVTGFANHRHP